MNTYTHLGLEDAAGEMGCMPELENAREEQDKMTVNQEEQCELGFEETLKMGNRIFAAA